MTWMWLEQIVTSGQFKCLHKQRLVIIYTYSTHTCKHERRMYMQHMYAPCTRCSIYPRECHSRLLLTLPGTDTVLSGCHQWSDDPGTQESIKHAQQHHTTHTADNAFFRWHAVVTSMGNVYPSDSPLQISSKTVSFFLPTMIVCASRSCIKPIFEFRCSKLSCDFTALNGNRIVVCKVMIYYVIYHLKTNCCMWWVIYCMWVVVIWIWL